MFHFQVTNRKIKPGYISAVSGGEARYVRRLMTWYIDSLGNSSTADGAVHTPAGE